MSAQSPQHRDPARHPVDLARHPIDPTSFAALAQRGLRYELVDTADPLAFGAWVRAEMRGFYGPEPSAERVAQVQAGLAYRRTSGVFDDGSAWPVGTVSSWIAELTVPGERVVDAWAISSVTVAGTHRRRGIASAIVEGELRTAAAAGVPLAILTVSESTIYGRFGFAPAAPTTSLTVDTRRARWAGPIAPGRVQFVELGEFRSLVGGLHEANRLTGSGEIDLWELRWDELVGSSGDDAERTKSLRAVRYVEPDGTVTGAALYRLSGGEEDFTAHTAVVERLTAVSSDASAALWRFLIELDLVTRVTAEMRPVDDPVLWQVSDMRAITSSAHDHLWLRILDVPAALSARRFRGSGTVVLEVSDPLGFAAGRFAVVVVDGVATVTAANVATDAATGVATDSAATLALSVVDLAALYLGGVSASTLVAAGRVVELQSGAAAIMDSTFGTSRAPWLSVWF